MDLLGGYGSDSSSSNDEHERPQKPSVPAAAAAAASVSARPPPPTGAAEAAAAATAATTTTPAGGVSRRGRRLLSLNAVLPPEIFERLTRGGAGGGGDADDSDGSSSGDEGGGGVGPGGSTSGRGQRRRQQRQRQPQPASPRIADTASGDVDAGEMGDLLRELRSAPSVGGDGSKGGGAASGAGAGAAAPAPEEKMGLAFTAVSTTVTSKKDVGVANVHAPSSSAPSSAAAARPSVAEPPPSPPPPQPQMQQPQQARRAAQVVVSLPRPGVSAAPPVRAPMLAAPVVPPSHSHSSGAAPRHSQHNAQGPTVGTTQQSRKKSKRDLERSLRAGNFDALSSSSDVMARTSNLAQHGADASTTSHVPTEADLAEAAARTAASRAAKAGAAGLRMYDPAAGTDVDLGGEVSTKHRSKHQINQLVASAAALEAHRASAAAGSIVKGGGSSRRVDAKRKYGW